MAGRGGERGRFRRGRKGRREIPTPRFASCSIDPEGKSGILLKRVLRHFVSRPRYLAVFDFGACCACCTIACTTHNDVVGVHFFGYNILIDMKIIYYSLLLYHLDVYCLKMDKLRKLR